MLSRGLVYGVPFYVNIAKIDEHLCKKWVTLKRHLTDFHFFFVHLTEQYFEV